MYHPNLENLIVKAQEVVRADRERMNALCGDSLIPSYSIIAMWVDKTAEVMGIHDVKTVSRARIELSNRMIPAISEEE